MAHGGLGTVNNGLTLTVINQSGASITRGRAVKLDTVDGTQVTIAKIKRGEAHGQDGQYLMPVEEVDAVTDVVCGVALHDMADGEEGQIIVCGYAWLETDGSGDTDTGDSMSLDAGADGKWVDTTQASSGAVDYGTAILDEVTAAELDWDVGDRYFTMAFVNFLHLIA